MTIHHHPDDATLMAYAAGAVPEGFSLVLAAHLESCPRCRDRLAEAQALGGELLETMAPAAPPGGGLAEVWDLIGDAAPEPAPPPPKARPRDGLPSVLAPYLERGFDDIPWRSLVPASGPGNLVVAGRCIGADVDAMSSFRVSPSCMAIGQAAGVGAPPLVPFDGLGIENGSQDLHDGAGGVVFRRDQIQRPVRSKPLVLFSDDAVDVGVVFESVHA